MANKKILIFHTSIGLGHKSLAENIGWHLEKSGYQVRLADIAKVQSGALGKFLIVTHGLINKYLPFFWSWLYKSRLVNLIAGPLRVPLAGRSYQKTLDFILEFQPDLVITTQTTASAVLSFLKKKKIYKKPWGIAFSDFHFHPFWFYPNADFYLANIEEQKQEMIKTGFNEKNIFLCGMTLKDRVAYDISQTKQRLKISLDEKVVLIASGSLGTGFDKKYLLNLGQKIQGKIIVVCGKNQNAFNELSNFLPKEKFLVLGFYQPMNELYAIADVFLTKPGGLSTAESLQYNLPIIVTHWLPGQEELNYQYLLENNLVLSQQKNLESLQKAILGCRQFRQQLENNPNLAKIFSGSEALLAAVRQFLDA